MGRIGSPREGEIHCYGEMGGRIKWARGWKGGVKGGIWGGATNTKGQLNNHMEIYYWRNFLSIYIHKRNPNGATK